MLQQFDDGTKYVKAVGFTFMSPEVILLFADHSKKYFHLYPPQKKTTAPALDLSDAGKQHVVLLRAADRLHELEAHADRIHRVVIFGKADDLIALKVPIIDAEVAEDNTIGPKQRQTKDVVMGRIENEAVDVPVDATVSPQNIKKVGRKMSTKPADKTTLRVLLRALRDTVKAAAKPGVSFVDDFGTPTILRITGDNSREEFKTVCKHMVESGVPEDQARGLYGWVEGFAGNGPDLAVAVEKYLHPSRKISDNDEYLAFLADEHKVDVDDICLVAEHYKAVTKSSAPAPVESETTGSPDPSDAATDPSGEDVAVSSPDFDDIIVPDELDVDPEAGVSYDDADAPEDDDAAEKFDDGFSSFD